MAVTSPVLSALQTASSQIKAAGQSSDSRVKALAAANVALNAKQAVDAVAGGQGLVKGEDGKLVEGNAADKAGGVGVSISLGASRSQSQQSSSADTARGSSVTAGGDISIRATGGGSDSDLTVRGSTVQAGGKTRLQAEDQINILAAQNTTQERNSSKNSSGSIVVPSSECSKSRCLAAAFSLRGPVIAALAAFFASWSQIAGKWRVNIFVPRGAGCDFCVAAAL